MVFVVRYTEDERSQCCSSLSRVCYRISYNQELCRFLESKAHTLPEHIASTRVLEQNGLRLVGRVVDPEAGPMFRRERILTPDS
jgi:hypothetical protein